VTDYNEVAVAGLHRLGSLKGLKGEVEQGCAF
jgi:hypothetical protein